MAKRILSIALVALACGAPNDGEAGMASEPGNGGSAAILDPDTSGARETEPTVTPFDLLSSTG